MTKPILSDASSTIDSSIVPSRSHRTQVNRQICTRNNRHRAPRPPANQSHKRHPRCHKRPPHRHQRRPDHRTPSNNSSSRLFLSCDKSSTIISISIRTCINISISRCCPHSRNRRCFRRHSSKTFQRLAQSIRRSIGQRRQWCRAFPMRIRRVCCQAQRLLCLHRICNHSRPR